MYWQPPAQVKLVPVAFWTPAHFVAWETSQPLAAFPSQSKWPESQEPYVQALAVQATPVALATLVVQLVHVDPQFCGSLVVSVQFCRQSIEGDAQLCATAR